MIRKLAVYTSLVLFIIPFCSAAQIKLEKRSFLDNRVELLVPAGLKPMSADLVNYKYPNRTQQPNVVLTDQNNEVNIVISLINEPLQESQILAFKEFQIDILKKVHPNAVWLDNGVKPVNGKSVGYFKLVSSAIDQTVFNYYFFTNMDGKVLLLTFNCPEKQMPKWNAAAEAIVASLKVR